MATLEEIWSDRSDMTKGARRASWEAGRYVSLALAEPSELDVSVEDMMATDWTACEVVDGMAVSDG